MDVREYEAQTKRLTLLAERLPPEAFQMLIMKTTGEAMSTTLESAEDDPMGAMAGQMAGSMPMAEPEPEMGAMGVMIGEEPQPPAPEGL
jgi:hypothetical protein